MGQNHVSAVHLSPRKEEIYSLLRNKTISKSQCAQTNISSVLKCANTHSTEGSRHTETIRELVVLTDYEFNVLVRILKSNFWI